MSYKISNIKNRPLFIGGMVGFVFSLILIVVAFACEWSFRIPDGGGYTSEAVILCLIPVTPSMVLGYFFHFILPDGGSTSSSFINFILALIVWGFHPLFFTCIGVGIGWIVSKIKQKMRK